MKTNHAAFAGKAAMTVLIVTSLALHFWAFGHPGDVAFDETLVGGFAFRYFSGTYYFDIHPPHLKLFYAWLAHLGGASAATVFPAFQQPYPASYYLVMRAFPAFCGTMLPAVAMALSQELGAKKIWAATAGWLLLFDTALMAESRLVLNDIPLLFFGGLGWLLFARWRRAAGFGPGWLLGAALSFAAATSVKWTGLAFLAPVFAVLVFDLWRGRGRASIQAFFGIAAIVLAWQVGGYAIHLSLLPKSGDGDAYMSASFDKRLDGSARGASAAQALSGPEAVLELNMTMARYARQPAAHPYGSAWFSWPFGWRGMFFWNDKAQSNPSRIYLLPNLVVWWTAVLGIGYLLINLAPRLVAALTRRAHAPINLVEVLIGFAYLCFFIPFIGIERVMFIYHYFPALFVSVMACSVIAGKIERPTPIAVALLLAAAAMFVWLWPVVYGLPLEQSAFGARMLLKSWP